MKKPNNNSIEIYMFYPKTERLEKKCDFHRFFTTLDKIDHYLDDCILFLNSQSALQYSRFINTPHVMLKAHVPEIAINGNGHGLSLKKGFLSKNQIEGCFPGWAKGMLYLENPEFKLNDFVAPLEPSANQAIFQCEAN